MRALPLVLLALLFPSAVSAEVGAWCWFADPRAVEWRGHVVYGYVNDDGSIIAADNRGRRFVLHRSLQRDDHNNPTFYVRRDGRLTAYWSAHVGDRLYYRTATGMRHWGKVHTGPANPASAEDTYTYPSPVRNEGKLFLFWSGRSHVAYSTSTDDGDTWGPARRLFQAACNDRPVYTCVRYIKYATGPDGIHFAWSRTHPRVGVSAIRHAVLRDGRVYHQDGRPIGKPPIRSTAGDVIYPATGGGSWIHDIAIGAAGPVIAYATFPGERHVYRYARWTSTGWRDEAVTDAGPSFAPAPEVYYSGGVSIDPANPARLYLSRKTRGEYEIERWTRGRRWRHRAITSGSDEPNVRPFVVGSAVGWMRGEYPSYTRFETRIEWRGG